MNNTRDDWSDKELPRYKCHKEVHALQIERFVSREYPEGLGIELRFIDEDYEPIDIKPPESQRIKKAMLDYHHDTEGGRIDTGYLVVYADGYRSWSPTKAFEEGYTRIDGAYSSDDLPVLGDGSSNPDYDIPERHD